MLQRNPRDDLSCGPNLVWTSLYGARWKRQMLLKADTATLGDIQ
jgi:hypothetical protein